MVVVVCWIGKDQEYMHIIHLVTRLLRAGSEENTIETCRWQAEAGHKVTLIHGRDIDPWWYNNPVPGVDLLSVPEMVHPLDPITDLRALKALRRIYRANRPDVIHTHQSKAGILGRLAASIVPEAVVAHTIHIVPFVGVSQNRRRFYVAAERLAARRTDVFIGVSEAVGHSFVDAGISRRGRVYCVRSGMDLARFRNPLPPEDWREILGIDQSEARPKVVLMLAAFEPRKRHLEFLRALERAGETLPDLRILLAGTGPEEAKVRAEVQALGLQNRVVFCGHRPDPESLLALADVSVLTSEREGLPRVVVQSIAAGCPVLVSDLPGINEVVQDGKNGHVVAQDDLDGIIEKMRAVLADEVTMNCFKSQAAATDLDAWSLARMGRQVTMLYGLPVVTPAVARAA